MDGDDGEATLRQLEAQHGALPATREVITGRGRHLYFRIRRHGAQYRRQARARHRHPRRGRLRARAAERPPVRPRLRLERRQREACGRTDWLVSALAEPETGKGRTLEAWHGLLTAPIPNGQRNDTLAAIAGKLLFDGVNLIMIRDLLQGYNLGRCDPPLPGPEIDNLVASVARTHLRKQQRDHHG